MKRLFFMLVLMTVVIGGIGFHRGWWSVQTDSEGGKAGINFTVDKEKIHDDKEKVIDQAHGVEQKVEAKVSR